MLAKNEGPYLTKIIRKSRNSFCKSSGYVGEHWQLTRSSNAQIGSVLKPIQTLNLLKSLLLCSPWYPLVQKNSWPRFLRSFWKALKSNCCRIPLNRICGTLDTAPNEMWPWAVEITQTLGPRARGILSSLRTLTNEAERSLDLPTRRSRHATSPWLST